MKFVVVDDDDDGRTRPVLTLSSPSANVTERQHSGNKNSSKKCTADCSRMLLQQLQQFEVLSTNITE